ncbi:response regulator PleD [compost metagenome]
MLPNTSPGGARLVAEKLRQSVVAMNIAHDLPVANSCLTVSIGLATLTPGIGSHCRQLISAADKGLYLAKNSGRNQVGIA